MYTGHRSGTRQPIIIFKLSGGVLLLGAGDGLSHRLHQRHLGVDHGAHLGDDPRRQLAAQHRARGFTIYIETAIPHIVSEPR